MDLDDLEALMRIVRRGPDLTAEQIAEVDLWIKDCIPIGANYRTLKLSNPVAAHNYLVIALATLLRTVSDNVDEALIINQDVRQVLIFIERGIDKEKWTDSKN